jgi:hypothetical protein
MATSLVGINSSTGAGGAMQGTLNCDVLEEMVQGSQWPAEMKPFNVLETHTVIREWLQGPWQPTQ